MKLNDLRKRRCISEYVFLLEEEPLNIVLCMETMQEVGTIFNSGII